MHSTLEQGDHVNGEGSVAQMVAVVSHDLKAPLSTIRLAVSYLAEELIPGNTSPATYMGRLTNCEPSNHCPFRYSTTRAGGGGSNVGRGCPHALDTAHIVNTTIRRRHRS
jgi:signal transduction histidine kinase